MGPCVADKCTMGAGLNATPTDHNPSARREEHTQSATRCAAVFHGCKLNSLLLADARRAWTRRFDASATSRKSLRLRKRLPLPRGLVPATHPCWPENGPCQLHGEEWALWATFGPCLIHETPYEKVSDTDRLQLKFCHSLKTRNSDNSESSIEIPISNTFKKAIL